MKQKLQISLKIAAVAVIALTAAAACSGQPAGQSGSGSVSGKAQTVSATDPAMNNMTMLTVTRQPGWQLLAGTQWIGITYINCIKGVNSDTNAGFFFENTRNYMQDQFNRSGTSDGKTVYLNVMTAADYLDYVFRRQFPKIKNARRTTLKTLDKYTEAERKQLEEQRVANFNNAVAGCRSLPNGQNIRIRNQYIDRSAAEYKWTDDRGDTVVHCMEVILNATHQDFVSRDLNTSSILWNQGMLITLTTPAKNMDKTSRDVEKMLSSVKFNEQYMAACNSIVMQGMQRNNAETQRIINEMAVSEMRHQQNMARQIQETNDYIANTRREVQANREASRERISQGWRDAIVGVDRYRDVNGKVMEVPVSMGSKVWQSADGGTVYTSDSYLFSPVDNLYDANGNIQQFRQLQLLR